MVLAARGRRNLDQGEEPVPDAAEADALRARGRRVLLASGVALLAAGLLVFLL